jgi:hypothetical protein
MIIEIILLILAVPAGLLIAYLARDELIQGQKWFKILVIASLALAGLFWMMNLDYISLTLVFIAIASFVSLVKSKDKKWVRKSSL